MHHYVGKQQDKKRLMAMELKKLSQHCVSQFHSIIYCSYRKDFKNLLSESRELIAYIESIKKPSENMDKMMTQTDAGWGCTIR